MSGFGDTCSSIEYSDFIFENGMVTIVALRSTPKIDLAGFSIGPFEEGHEYEVKFWVARELERDGIARIREGALDATKLYKIQWTERIQAVGQLSTLPEDFYPRLRRLIDELKAASKVSPEKMREYEYVQNLAQDVINCRLRKIISLASIPAPESHILKNLTLEEKELYERIHQIIADWRARIV
ncbi:MAG: hypothetical protein QW600_02305 [Candidatus Bathyarchaeia archaeon]|nr:DNA replication complex GINS family protein [Candidatus Bathyarchaeota archaeon]